MKKLLIIITVIISVVGYACRHLPPEQPAAPVTGGGGTVGGGGGGGSVAVCFQSEILPIFQTNCAKSGCHDAASARRYILDSYDNLFKKDGKFEKNNIIPGDPVNSKLFEVLNKIGNDRMPKLPNPALTTEQKNLIARWITEGAKNTINCISSCDSNQFKYSANIQPILQNHCTGCHSGSNPPNGVNLTTYTLVKPLATNGMLYGVTAHLPGYNPMPKGSGKLSDCEIAQIRKWVQAGAQNN